MSLFLLFEELSEDGLIDESNSDLISENACSDHSVKIKLRNNRRLSNELVIVDKHYSRRTKAAWSLVLIIMSSFFMAAAYVQHNDPDPYIWMLAYLAPCGINFALLFFAFRPAFERPINFWKFLNWIITIHICYCYTLGFWTLAHYIHRQIWDDERVKILATMVSEPNMLVEEAKELIGLCLVIAWLSFVNNGNFLKFGVRGIVFGGLLTALPIVSWIFIEKLEENREKTCF